MAAKKKTPAKKSAPKKKPVMKSKSKARAPAKKTSAKKSSARKSTSSKKTSASAKKFAGKKGERRPVRASKRPALKRKAAAPKKKVVKAPVGKLPEAPEALALARRIAAVAVEKKAENVMVIDTRARSSAVGYDYVVLASGDSDRQIAAIQEGVDALLKPEGKRANSVEASPDWVCANFDEGVVAHFFTPDRRDQMDLEELWRDAPRVSL